MPDNPSDPSDRSPGLSHLPPELARRVEAELDRGERLVWAGQPHPGLYSKQSGCMVAMGVFFLISSLIWIAISLVFGLVAAGAAKQEGKLLAAIPCCIALFGLPFVAVSVGLLASPIWLRGQARRCCYALTDRRALVWEPSLFGNRAVRTYTRAGLGRITRVENADGSGSLVFEEYTVSSGDGTRTSQHGFLHIAGVRAVEQLLRRTLLDGGNG